MRDARDDVLGDVLGLGLLRGALHRQLLARAPWGITVPDRGRAALYLVARGSAWLEVEGEAPRLLEAGHVAFLPRPVPHVLRDSPDTVPVEVCESKTRGASSATRRIGGRGAPTSILVAFFEVAGKAPPLLDRRAEVVVLVGDAGEGDPVVRATIDLVLAELAAPGPASVLVLQRLADVLVVHALRALTRQRPCAEHAPRPGLVALSDARIHDALGLLHAHVDHAWTVAELAARVGLSRSGLAARFTELVGEPPLQYLARWRLSRAAELLRDSDEPVGAIAARVGYESIPSFNKAFKRWQGTSPGAFRRAAAPT